MPTGNICCPFPLVVPNLTLIFNQGSRGASGLSEIGWLDLEDLVISESLNNASRPTVVPLCVHPRQSEWSLVLTIPVLNHGRQQHHRNVDAKASCPRVRRDSVSKGASDIPSFLHSFLASMTSLLRSCPRSSPVELVASAPQISGSLLRCRMLVNIMEL